MTSTLRWRFMTLQALLIVVFSFAAGFSFWASGYVHNNVSTELKAQQIAFPAKGDSGTTAKALTPCGSLPKSATCTIPTSHAIGVANSNTMNKYAGQILTTGVQARAYANSYIAVHLSDMGKTYSQASYYSMTHPTDKAAADLVTTIFKGTSLRGMLLNSYGWWSFGSYVGMAGIGAVLAAIAVFFAFCYEALLVFRRKTVPVRATRSASVPAAI